MNAISTTISAGSSCNNACRFCEVASSGAPTVEPFSEERVVAAIAASGWNASAGAPLEVVFTGGEPTLQSTLEEAVGFARRHGAAAIVVRTNGRMLAYKGFAATLATAGVDRVEVAIHGHEPAVHEWETRVDGSFKQSLRGLRRARKAGCVTGVNTVVTRSNYRHLSEIAALVVGAGASYWRLHYIRPVGAAAHSPTALVAPRAMQSPFVRRATQVAERHGVSVRVLSAPIRQQHGVHAGTSP